LLKELNYVNYNISLNKFVDQMHDPNKKEAIFKKLEKEHTLSKFLIRNRKKNVISEDYINERIVKTILVNPKQEELEIYNEIRLYLAKIYNMAGDLKNRNIGLGFVITTLQKLLTSSKYAFLKSLERRLKEINNKKDHFDYIETIKKEDPEYFESELEERTLDNGIKDQKYSSSQQILNLENQEKILLDFYKKLVAIPYDSKSEKLLELLNRIHQNNPKEKLIIFTQFVDTLKFLKKRIEREKSEFFVETFYGGKNKQEKAESVRNFRENDSFSILLSTEIGGEGRNFQFCRILINYDLPWNPMKLEQRIGRLDRIGQKSEKIYIYNFFMEGTIETDIIFALNKRINLFKESIGKLEPIIGKIEEDFKDLIFTDNKEKQKKLREFNRNLDDQIKKTNEMEMQLDDLLIDKKSFQMDTLMNYLSCGDVKLTYNELYHLIDAFFSLENGKYGELSLLNHSNITKKDDIKYLTRISLSTIFLEKSRKFLERQYEGTFDLELAKAKEEKDFFALGHPLINEILKFCKSDIFNGSFTKLTLKKQHLPKNFQEKLVNMERIYLFIFKTKFHGFLIEENLIPLIIDKNGKEIKDLEEIILDIKNFDKFYSFGSERENKIEITEFKAQNLIKRAEILSKEKNLNWKSEIFRLNDKLFKIELKKKEKFYNYKKRALEMKLKNLRIKLERKENQKPSEKQMENINKIKDKERRSERLKDLEKLEEQILFLKNDIKNTENKIDELEFFYEDKKKDLERRNSTHYHVELYSFAEIILDY